MNITIVESDYQVSVVDETIQVVAIASATGGIGDMLKSVYDTNNDGIVDDAEEANSVVVDVVAEEDLGQYQVATVGGRVANSSILSTRGKVVGITREQILTGFSGKVVQNGEISNALWNWAKDDMVYLNGDILSTIAPSSGYIQKIAKAKNSQTLIVELGETILL